MAAGAIPPPLFFERRHRRQTNFARACLLADHGNLEGTQLENISSENISSVDLAFVGRRA
jgi:hypothetical protein